MEKNLISIVVPIYKVERYLRQCIESIQKQTYTNLEIILVDDGSPDQCGNICEEYAKEDSRIVVVHKENGGLSDARNAGIKIAKGKYIAFIDSDDYIEKNYVEFLYYAITENRVDIAQCGINQVTEEGRLLKTTTEDVDSVKTAEEILEGMCQEEWNNVVVWNKLYARKLFENIQFPKGKIHEDEFTTYKIVYTVEKVAVICEPLYNYRNNNNSITKRKFNQKTLDGLEALKERLAFYKKEKKKTLYNLALIHIIGKLRFYYEGVRLEIENSNDLQKELLKEYRKLYKQAKKMKEFKRKDKIRSCIFYYMPNLWTWAKSKKEMEVLSEREKTIND